MNRQVSRSLVSFFFYSELKKYVIICSMLHYDSWSCLNESWNILKLYVFSIVILLKEYELIFADLHMRSWELVWEWY